MTNEEARSGGETFAVVNPATGREVGRYPLMGRAEVDRVVARARETAAEWAQSSFAERKKILCRAAAILADDGRRYAEVVAEETGKTVMDAVLADLFPVGDLLSYYGKNAKKFLQPVKVGRPALLPGRKAYYTFEPKGVVGVISPWNYPFTLSAGPTISALAAGNTVVLKPSSQTTRSGLILQEILEQAGLPRGALQVITGSGSRTGQLLIEHPGLDMLFFTGSTAVGRMVNVKAAERLIPAVMELGGKDAAIVTRQADLDRAAHAAVWGAFFNCGQTCISIELCLVDRAVYEPFLAKVLAIAKDLRSGSRAGEIGSMTMADQLAIVETQVADAREKGAQVLTGGAREGGGPGLFYPPTILTEVTPEMKVMTEETFGPVLPIVPYDNILEALELANRGPYGLSGAVFTRDLEEGRWIARRMHTGSVNINDCLVAYVIPALPFGGVKQSGVGRYHGRLGLQAFCNIKAITEFAYDLTKEPYYYPFPPEGDAAALAVLSVLHSHNPLRRFTALVKLLPGAIKFWRYRNK